MPISDTTPIRLCPSPCGHHETPMPNNRNDRWFRNKRPPHIIRGHIIRGRIIRATSFGAASFGPFPRARCTDALRSCLSVGIVVVDRIQAETSPFLSDGSPVPAYEPHERGRAVLNNKPVTHRAVSHGFHVAPRVILNMRSAGLRFTKLRIGVVQESRVPGGPPPHLIPRSADNDP